MYRVSLHFYNELNKFLPQEKRDTDFEFQFTSRRSVKDLIESFGIPHTEIDVIFVNDTSVDFSYIVQDGDNIKTYPASETLNSETIKHLKPRFETIKFLVDIHLNKLARYLRLLGLDAICEKNLTSERLIEKALDENRILVTRSRNLLRTKEITLGVLIKEDIPEKQLEEIFHRYDFSPHCNPFTRCMECNTILQPIEKEKIIDRLPPKVKVAYQSFTICTNCDKIYWQGTHIEKLNELIERIIKK